MRLPILCTIIYYSDCTECMYVYKFIFFVTFGFYVIVFAGRIQKRGKKRKYKKGVDDDDDDGEQHHRHHPPRIRLHNIENIMSLYAVHDAKEPVSSDSVPRGKSFRSPPYTILSSIVSLSYVGLLQDSGPSTD